MQIENVNWKIFLENPEAAEPDAFFRVFNTWIPDSPEVFVDVADYKHVHDGPLVLLAGHYVNYALDAMEGRLGLLYDRRQPMEGTAEEKLARSLGELLRCARRLEGDPGFSTPPRFSAVELLLVVNNRALAPNTPETFTALRPHLEAALDRAYGGGRYALEYSQGDPRGRFSVTVRSQNPPALARLAGALSGQ